MKHHYVPTDPGQLDFRIADDDRRAVTAYSDRSKAAEAASALSMRSGRQLSTREVAVLPDWIAYIDNEKRHDDALREDGPADRLSPEARKGWIDERAGTRVSIETAKPAAPWCHPHATGSVVTIDNVIDARGQDHLEGGAARSEMITAVDAGGAAWLIAAIGTELYLRPIEASNAPWTGTSGIEKKNTPGAVIGGLIVGPGEAAALRAGIRSEQECALRYLRILECFWRGEGYRVRIEQLHACAQCPSRHWTTTRLSMELYTGEEAAARAARDRLETGSAGETGWTPVPIPNGNDAER